MTEEPQGKEPADGRPVISPDSGTAASSANCWEYIEIEIQKQTCNTR
jgi:hypothetical protein